MKAEFTAFNQLASELYRCNFITKEDYERTIDSLASKGHGFIRDMEDLANDIRLGLSNSMFRLSEHTNCVFERRRGSVLPKFLWGALSKVFDSCGVLRDDASAYHAATCIQFLSSLKRVDPPKSERKILEQKVWSSLLDNFSDEERVVREVEEALGDTTFRALYDRVKFHFRSILAKAEITPDAVFGPGKNIDRFEAITSMDWYVAEPPSIWNHWNPIPKFLRWFVDDCRTFINHAPRGTHLLVGGTNSYPMFLGEPVMKCSAQPKSYKSFRGVGVTSAFRMALQISLQRSFYNSALTENLPLRDQDVMKENLRQHFDEIGTIDLSSASDRCYWRILKSLGEGIPFFDACYALRTEILDLPTGRTPCLSPIMGEAITFPLMSTFFAAIALAVCDHYGHGHELVKVYGDDIQSPHFELTCWLLRKFGAIPSPTKSYPPESHFKESCEAHYCKGGSGSLRNCRPCFLPSFELNIRGRLCHVDAFKLLTLAKESFMRFEHMATACCDFVQKYLPSLHIPRIPFNSPFLGRPTLSRYDGAHIKVSMADSQSFTMSERGIRRSILRSPLHPVDAKLHAKYQWRFMSKNLKHLRVEDDFRELEHQLLVRSAYRSGPWAHEFIETVSKNRRKFSTWLKKNVPSDCISQVINETIAHVQQHGVAG